MRSIHCSAPYILAIGVLLLLTTSSPSTPTVVEGAYTCSDQTVNVSALETATIDVGSDGQLSIENCNFTSTGSSILTFTVPADASSLSFNITGSTFDKGVALWLGNASSPSSPTEFTVKVEDTVVHDRFPTGFLYQAIAFYGPNWGRPGNEIWVQNVSTPKGRVFFSQNMSYANIHLIDCSSTERGIRFDNANLTGTNVTARGTGDGDDGDEVLKYFELYNVAPTHHLKLNISDMHLTYGIHFHGSKTQIRQASVCLTNIVAEDRISINSLASFRDSSFTLQDSKLKWLYGDAGDINNCSFLVSNTSANWVQMKTRGSTSFHTLWLDFRGPIPFPGVVGTSYFFHWDASYAQANYVSLRDLHYYTPGQTYQGLPGSWIRLLNDRFMKNLYIDNCTAQELIWTPLNGSGTTLTGTTVVINNTQIWQDSTSYRYKVGSKTFSDSISQSYGSARFRGMMLTLPSTSSTSNITVLLQNVTSYGVFTGLSTVVPATSSFVLKDCHFDGLASSSSVSDNGAIAIPSLRAPPVSASKIPHWQRSQVCLYSIMAEVLTLPP